MAKKDPRGDRRKGKGGKAAAAKGSGPKGKSGKVDPESTEIVNAKKTSAKAKKRKKGARGRKAPKRTTSRGLPDPSDHPDSTVRFIGGYEATKTYLCPGCQRDIPEGQPHIVAVPPEDADLRRHWHRGCWERRASSRY